MRDLSAVGALFTHADLHKMDEHVIPKTCSFPNCVGVEFKSLLSYIEHQIFEHTSSLSHILQYLGLVYVEHVQAPPTGQFYNADNPDDAILHTKPRLKGAGYRSRVASRSASPTLTKSILKRDLSCLFEKNHHEEKQGEKLGEQKISSKSSNKINCCNEKHQVPWSFPSIIEKTKHLISSHSCPLVKCTFYCEFDSDMITHMDCMHEAPKKI